MREAQGRNRLIPQLDWFRQSISLQDLSLGISLDSLFIAFYICVLTTKNGERTSPTTVRPLSIHQTNSMCAKKQMLL